MKNRRRILIAESSRTQAEWIDSILGESEYDVKITSGGEEALSSLDSFQPELLISDTMLPELNGYGLCKKIKSDAKWKNLPVLLIISLGKPENMIVGLECGADAYLINPPDEKILLEKTNNLLRKYSEKNENEKPAIYHFNLLGKEYAIKTCRYNMVDMLLTVYESAIEKNKKLVNAQEELIELNASLEEKVHEGTRELQEKFMEKQSLDIKLEQNELRYQRLAENANVGVVIADLEGFIRFANFTVAKILDRRSQKFLLGENLMTYFDTKKTYTNFINELNSKGKIPNSEMKLLSHKRMPRWVTLNAVLSDDLINVMIFDKTGKKFAEESDMHYRDVLKNAKEKAELSDQQKSRFLASIAYQFKVPLNKIIGYSALMADPGLAESLAKDYKITIQLSFFELSNKISNVLELAKIEAGQVVLTERGFRLHQLFNEICKEFNERINLIQKKDLEIVQQLDSLEKDLTIVADRDKLYTVMHILMENAIKYSMKGVIILSAFIKSSDLIIQVKDCGPGIPKENQQKIFQRFSQINNVSENKETGLGLTIAKQLLKMMNGTIWVESDSGKGASFFFLLPLNEKKMDISLAKAKSLAAGLAILSKMTILVAEDSYDNYLLLTAYLEHTGARILWAKSGNETLAIFESGIEINIILMDIKIPQRSKIDTIKLIRLADKTIPIIAVTDISSAEAKKSMFNTGVNDYIIKPFNQDILISTLVKNLQENKN